MKIVRWITVNFFLAVLLTGCGPVYETHYIYEPPHSNLGKMCSAQCIQNKTNCQQLCQIHRENCEIRARQDSLLQYELYKSRQRAAGLSIDMTPDAFNQSGRCHESCNCTDAFNLCYQTCGGKVKEYQVCTAFCNQ